MINFCDLSIPEATEGKIWAKAKELVAGNGYILGSEVNQFEDAFAQYCESKHSVGVATGCYALLWAIKHSVSAREMKSSRLQIRLLVRFYLFCGLVPLLF